MPKISALTQDTAPTATDYIVTVDTETGVTKKVLLSDLLANLPGSGTSYVPVWTASSVNPAIGNGTITGSYIRVGKLVFFRIKMVMGSTTTFGTGGYRLTLPITSVATTGIIAPIGQGVFLRQSVAFVPIWLTIPDGITTYAEPNFNNGTASITNVGPTSPQTWANTDVFAMQGIYEAA